MAAETTQEEIEAEWGRRVAGVRARSTGLRRPPGAGPLGWKWASEKGAGEGDRLRSGCCTEPSTSTGQLEPPLEGGPSVGRGGLGPLGTLT
jgi:hypothetical protein